MNDKYFDVKSTDRNSISFTSEKEALKKQEIILYKVRWHMLFQFCLINATTAVFWLVFSPIPSQIESHFNVTSHMVDLMSVIYLTVYFPGTFLCIYLFDRCDLRAIVIFSALFMTTGGWVRYIGSLVNDNHLSYGIILVGQAISGFSQPLIVNSSVAVSYKNNHNCLFYILCIILF